MVSTPLQLALWKCTTAFMRSFSPLLPVWGIWRSCFPQYPLPSLLTFCIFICLWIPASFVLSRVVKYVRRRHAADRLGASLVPCVRGRILGNIDVLIRHIDLCDNGYVDDAPRRLLLDIGENATITRVHVLWDGDILTVEPEYIKIMLATEFSNFVKGEEFAQAVNPVLGSGVFNSDGDLWKFHRSMTRPFFSRDRISDFELFHHHAERCIELLRSRVTENVAIDFQDLISRFTLDSATSFLFGKCVDSLNEDLPYPHNHPTAGKLREPKYLTAKDFAASFGATQDALSDRMTRSSLWPFFEMKEDKTKKPMEEVRRFLQPVIDSALEKERRRKSMDKQIEKISDHNHDPGEIEETLLADLVRKIDDPVILQDEVLNILLAARDTTLAALTFSVYMLALHPSILSRLREDILQQIGATEKPTFEAIRHMKYLHAFINEVLRLYPPLPMDVRRSVKDTTFPSTDGVSKPYYIPAKTTIWYSLWTMHRRTDLWGPDAEEFDPDRWLDERKKYVTLNPSIFLPFNTGPRICLGQQFAYNQISFMLICILQIFSSVVLDLDAQPPESLPPAEWSHCAGTKGTDKIRVKRRLTLFVEGGLWVKFA